MKASQMLSKIKSLLGEEVKLAEVKLENGTILEAESFEKGNEVFIKTEDERVALPVGEYLMEDGKTLTIIEEGIIDEIMVKEQEEVEAVQAAEHEEEKKEKLEYVTKDELKKEMDNLAVELKEHIKKLMEHKKEEKMSEEVKEELSAAVEPIAHNPEEVSKKKINLLSQNKTLTTQDIVFNKLFNK